MMLDSLKVKKGVDISHLKGPMDRVLIVYALYCEGKGVQGVITDGRRPKGKVFSLHTSGNAVDLRGREFSKAQQSELTMILATVLGSDYDVIFYPSFQHWHVEYDKSKENDRTFSLKLDQVE